jgi:hypothetical protein
MEPRRASLRWLPDLLSAALLVGALGSLWYFFLVDQRPPMDLGHYFSSLPAAWRAWGELDLAALLGVTLQAGGIYNLGIALACHLFGRGAALLELVEYGWLGLLLVASWGAARRLGGAWAGLAGVALTAALPVVHSGARSHWIHLPEASLLMAALWLWLLDPSLARRGVRLGLLACLGLAFCLRPTALIFGGPLLLLLWRSAPHRRWLTPSLSLLAVVTLLPSLPDYVGGKAMIREVYEGLVAPLGPSLVEQAFVLPGLIVVLGLLLLPWLARVALRRPGVWLLGSWSALGLGLSALFHVGPDNFPLLFVGGALLAAQALALPGEGGWRRGARPVVALGLTGLSALSMGAPLMLPHLADPFHRILGPGILSVEPHMYLRPQTEVLTLEQLWPLFDEVCVETDGVCTVLASKGLVNYNREDDLSLAAFLAGRDDLVVHNAGQFFFVHDIESPDALEGLFVLECPMAPPEPDNMFREREQALEALVGAFEVSIVHHFGAPRRCSFWVFRVEEEDPLAALEAFWLDYPWRYSGPRARPPGGEPQRR